MLKKWFTLPTVEEAELPAVPPQTGPTNRPPAAQADLSGCGGQAPPATLRHPEGCGHDE